MAVFVDDARLPFRHMLMSHMVADSREELDQMADAIGIGRRWIQKPGTPEEHYDVCQSSRQRALKLGAISIDSRRLVAIIRARRER